MEAEIDRVAALIYQSFLDWLEANPHAKKEWARREASEVPQSEPWGTLPYIQVAAYQAVAKAIIQDLRNPPSLL